MDIKKVAYVSGTRADFGLMTSVLKAIDHHPELELQMYATGIHLLSEFGRTESQVKAEFPNTRVIEATFETDDRVGMASFTGRYLSELVRTFSQDRPDFVLTLGDRVEMLCSAMACAYLGIPTGQVHGGERTFTVDELARHAITKLSQLHFVATQESARRVKKLGEESWRIHLVGAPALDTILNEKLPTRDQLFSKLGLKGDKPVILVVQHPVSEELSQAAEQMRATLEAVKSFNLPVVVVFPHADAGGRAMIQEIEKERSNALFHIFPSLEYKTFLSLEREASVMVGNSSAGMIESSSFRIPVVNIGARQLGRQHGENVINVDYQVDSIEAAIDKSLNDRAYKLKLVGIKNPWGGGQAGSNIAKVLAEVELGHRLLAKQITY